VTGEMPQRFDDVERGRSQLVKPRIENPQTLVERTSAEVALRT